MGLKSDAGSGQITVDFDLEGIARSERFLEIEAISQATRESTARPSIRYFRMSRWWSSVKPAGK
jgi:hypothetical protein